MSICLAAWICVGLVAILSLLPADDMVRTTLGGHVEHAIAYAGTAFLLRLGYPVPKLVWVILGLVLYAGILECLQNFSPGRHPAFEDWLSSSFGAFVGSAAAQWTTRNFQSPRHVTPIQAF